MRALAIASVLVAGCLSGSYNGDMSATPGDMSVSVEPPDLSITYNFDLSGLDLAGLSNCAQLNLCEQGKTPAQALMCEQNATPPAKAKEADLQSCFKKYCPVVADMAAGVCAPNDMGVTSAMCQTCIDNTYVAAGAACDPPTAPECHMCLHEAEVCLADK